MSETRRRGFTLVEVLVTIAVVSILVGLLAPSLSRIKVMTRSMQCQSNLRQMGIAATSYSATWDLYPTAIRYEIVDGQFRQVAWDWVTTFDGELISPGPLWAFSTNPGHVQQCPSYDGPTNTTADPHSGYNYNTSFIGGEAEAVMPGWDIVRPGVAPHACRRSESCAMFGCGGYANGANKFMRAPLGPEPIPTEAVYSGGQAFRHAGDTNAVFIDGHIESRSSPRRGDLADETLLHDWLDFPSNGFLSDDNSAYDPR